MKTNIKHILVLAMMAAMSIGGSYAQETNTTIMLDMAPYRHYINPAFEPITDGYFYLPAISRLSVYAGNNSLTLGDLVINQDGKTMLTIHPDSKVNLYDAFKPNMLTRANLQTSILGCGWRTRKGGYAHIGIDAMVDAGVSLPRDLFGFLLNGGMQDLTQTNTFNLSGLGVNVQAYLALSIGYSKAINERWAWGLKVKAIDGLAYVGMHQNQLDLNMGPDAWNLQGNGYAAIAGPFASYPAACDAQSMQEWIESGDIINVSDYKKLLTPSGAGAALDLGLTYQPEKHVKISLSVTDLGAIYWFSGKKMGYDINGTYTGIGSINYGDYVGEDGNFNGQMLGDTILSRLETVYKTALTSNDAYEGGKYQGFFAPLTMKLNAGVDAYVANGLVGFGLYSKTMLYESKLYEELTVGAALRPASWFNLAVTYSILNGRSSNIGAALGLRGGPFVLTLAADYVPLTYAKLNAESGKTVGLPYKTAGVNVDLGLSIVWGWKKKAKTAAQSKVENFETL